MKESEFQVFKIEDSVSAAFFGRWRCHVVFVEVTEIGVGVGGCEELLSFEVDACEREDHFGAVHDSVAVVVQCVGKIFSFHSRQTRQIPKCFEEEAFRGEIEEFRRGSPGVVVLTVQNGVASAVAFCDSFDEVA